MTDAAATPPDFMSAMLDGLDQIDETTGAVPDVNALPVVDDNPEGGAEDHGELEGADGGDGAGGDAAAGGGDPAANGNAVKDAASGASNTPEANAARKAAAAGRERNPDGTFKPTAAEIAAAAAAKPDAAAAAAAALAAKKPDAINDPIPANLKPATSERMTALVDIAKTLTTRAETAEKDLDGLVNTVTATGMNGQEFGELLEVVGDARSTDPARQEKAFEYFQKVTAHMAAQLGKTVPGADPLEGHEDLRSRVAAGQLLKADAEQLASSRRTAAAGLQRQQQEQQRQQLTVQQQADAAAVKTKARADMVDLETTLAAADPQFAAKKTILMADAPFMATLKATPPAQWTTVFGKKYRETKVAAPVVPAAQLRRPGGPQPLRGKAPAGGQQVTAAKTMEEAMGNIDFSKIG